MIANSLPGGSEKEKDFPFPSGLERKSMDTKQWRAGDCEEIWYSKRNLQNEDTLIEHHESLSNVHSLEYV